MGKWICAIVVVVGGMAVSAGCAGSTARCERAIGHIRSVVQSGDLAVAKMLIDAAIEDEQLECTDEQCEALSKLQEDIYTAYIIDRLRIAKDDVLARSDGYAALRSIGAAARAAEDMDIELKEINGLCAAAFFSAACQDLMAAREAEDEGDVELRDRLRAEASKFISWALALDPRVKPLVQRTFGQ